MAKANLKAATNLQDDIVFQHQRQQENLCTRCAVLSELYVTLETSGADSSGPHESCDRDLNSDDVRLSEQQVVVWAFRLGWGRMPAC